MEWLHRLRQDLDYLFGRGPLEPDHIRLGKQGEFAASDYLRQQGYLVVGRRWQRRGIPGELDLIAWKGSLLCIIEVKTRSNIDQTPPAAAVDRHKRETIRRLTRAYLRLLPAPEPPIVRFDIISVYLIDGKKPELKHFESAFAWREQWMH